MILIERELLLKKLTEIKCLIDENNDAYISFNDIWHVINQIPSVDEVPKEEGDGSLSTDRKR